MRTILFILIFGTFLSCTSTDNKETSSTVQSTSSVGTTSAPNETVLNFLTWYNDNGRNLASNLVLNSSRENWDSTKFYAVNFQATEEYLQTLTSTKMISNKYVDKWRNYFKGCDQKFKENPQNDGPAEGFDYDFIVFSQEDPGLGNLSKAKIDILKQDENVAEISIKFPSDYKYKYYLSKYDNNWLIDDIEPVHQ